MEQMTIQEFGGEVKFTKYIADNKELGKRLLKAAGYDQDDENFTITAEEHTTGSKRVDLIVRDEDNNVVQVIESQDANGWLDPVHASKIAWYCHDKGCNDGVLICKDSENHMKDFIQWYNENTPLNIVLLSPSIFKDSNGEVEIYFTTLLRPTDWAHKRIKPNTNHRNDQPSDWQIERAVRVEELFDEYSDIFTNKTRDRLSANNINNTNINVALYLLQNSYHVQLRHDTRHADNTVFMDSVLELYPDANFTRNYSTVGYFKTLEDSVNLAKQLINQIDGGEILVNNAPVV